MGSATIRDDASGNAATVTFPDGTDRATVDAALAKVAPTLRQGAPGGAAFGAELAKTPAAPTSYRTPAGVAGAVGGGLLGGLKGGVRGALHGATTGYGLTSAADDYIEGRGDWRRDLLTGVGSTLLGPYTKGMSLAKQMLGAGGGAALMGGAYDVASGDVSRETLPEATARTAGDVLAGGAGKGMAEAAGPAYGAPGRRASALPESEQKFREGFAQEEGIPLPASARTGSKAVAKTEAIPSRAPLGADEAAGFYDRQLAATEASIEKRLQRLDVVAASRNPTVAGETTQAELPKLAGEVDRAAEQAFGAVKKAFRPGVSTDVMPTKWVATAEAIVNQGRGAPYPTPGNAGGIAASHTATPPPIPVLYNASGQPITLQQIASQPEPMTYDQARFYLKQMGARAFKNGQPVIGDVDDGIRKQLWSALNDDVSDMMKNHPEAHELYRWAKRGYGMTKELVVDRLQKLTKKLEPEKVAPAIFRPGALKRTMQMKQILPRERFEELAGALANTWMEKAQTATSSGRAELSTAKLATMIKPYAESGQLDVMFEPDVADYFRQYVRFEPALQSTERLAGNRSGTAQALLGAGQLGALAQPALRPSDPAAYGEAATAALPMALAKFVFSQPGIDALTTLGTEGAGPTMTRATLANPVAAQIAQRGIQSPFMRWLSRQQ